MRIGFCLEVDLWDRSSPAISALVDTNRYVVLATTCAASVGMASLLFSRFSLGYSAVIFSVCSITVMLLTCLVPLFALSVQVRRKKKENTKEISRLIQKEYGEILK